MLLQRGLETATDFTYRLGQCCGFSKTEQAPTCPNWALENPSASALSAGRRDMHGALHCSYLTPFDTLNCEDKAQSKSIQRWSPKPEWPKAHHHGKRSDTKSSMALDSEQLCTFRENANLSKSCCCGEEQNIVNLKQLEINTYISIRGWFAIGSAVQGYFYLCTLVFLSKNIIVYNGNNL